ncbi:hypothetical protein ACRAWF_18680 [Streptomyces sp. L7]
MPGESETFHSFLAGNPMPEGFSRAWHRSSGITRRQDAQCTPRQDRSSAAHAIQPLLVRMGHPWKRRGRGGLPNH